MLSEEDNELITNTDRGAPMGELFRRFWLPVALAAEFPGPDGAPIRLRVMGEDLIAFRDSDGRAGLIEAYCAHRGAPLFFSRNEECGLRCIYHGWKYDVEGNCVDLPNTPEGETFKEKIKLTSYAIVEAGDLVWAYMGPRDRQPPFPSFAWTALPSSHRYVTRYELECNYLQAMEGDFDQTHARFLHSTLDNNLSSPGNELRGADNDQLRALSGSAAADEPFPRAVGSRRVGQLPWLDVEDNEAGFWLITGGRQPSGESYVNVNQAWMMPVFSQIGLAGPSTNSINIRVPIDNASMTIDRLRWSHDPIPERELDDYKHSGYSYPELMPGTWRLKDNIYNDYNVDRVAQRAFSYSGIKAFPTQDVALVENQWGPTADRTREHLAASDQQIIQLRQRLVAAAKALIQGSEPKEPWHPEAYAYLRGRASYEADAAIVTAIEAARAAAMGRPLPEQVAPSP